MEEWKERDIVAGLHEGGVVRSDEIAIVEEGEEYRRIARRGSRCDRS